MSHRTVARWLTSLALVGGCTTPLSPRGDGGSDVDASLDRADAASVDAGTTGADAPVLLDAMGPDSPGGGTDGAMLVSVLTPHALGCTARANLVVTMLNTGTSTWTEGAYALAAVDGTDPLHTTDARVALAAGESVAPGAMHEFVVTLAAPGAAGTYVTDWRMSHEAAAFGDTSTQSIDVFCESVSPADFDLAAVTIVSSPDVRPFAVTSSITSLSFSPGTIHIDHTLRGTWPPVVISDDGTTQEATIWVLFHIGGTWYATGGERLRPDQTDKALPNPSWIGNEWLYDAGRWGVMTGYVPSPGDLVGFMVVAGSTRSDDHVIVRERTGVVLVPFPPDDATTSFPPFAFQEMP